MHCSLGLQNHSCISAACFRFYPSEEEPGQCNGTMQLFVTARCGVNRVSDNQGVSPRKELDFGLKISTDEHFPLL